MKSRDRIASGICLCVAFAVVAVIYPGIARAQGGPHAIHLKSYQFTPGVGDQPRIPPGLMIAEYAQNQRGYYLVQFKGPVEQSWKDELTAVGAEILDYVPDFTFKVRMNPGEARRAAALASVAWADIFHPAYKLSPDLVRDGTQVYVVHAERGADHGLVQAAVAATGAQILSREEGILTVSADSDQLDAIARVLDVAWVQNYTMWKKHNEFAGGVILGSAIANQNGYTGSTQTVAVADTGLGGGTAATGHADISSGRITAIYNWPGSPSSCFQTVTDDGAVDVDSGHGTHTAVSAVGDGSSPGVPAGRGKGTAPAAKLVFQAVENYATISWLCQILNGYPNGYYLTGLPSDLNLLYQQAYAAGARIHSNSWGASAKGAYDANSASTDSFVWNHRDMVITFSAGNDGKDANGDGIVDLGSMGSPGTAKNVITVGASENQRQEYPCDTNLSYTDCNTLNGSNSSIIATYGAAFGFTAPPLSNDLIAGNQEQMAAFSSRGPTTDGRIKPDVVAPGTYVLSGYSDMYQQQYDTAPNPKTGGYQYDGWAYPESQYHKYLGGTSMSNPLVAGSAAVVRDYYAKAKSTPNVSAALTKATIINSAVDLLDENNDGVNDNDYPIPNNHEGWGRVDLAAATDGHSEFVDNTSGISTNGATTYTATVSSPGALKVTLVWSDYPSVAGAAVNLVNDLDLKVTSPGGSIRLGNVFSGGWSAAGGSADRRNNVENVYIQSADPGDYTIEVKGYNVPYGPQPFALVIRAPEQGTEPPPNLIDRTVTFDGAPESAAYQSTFAVTSSTNPDSLTQPVYSSSGACANIGPTYTMTSGTGTCTSTVTYAADGKYKAGTKSQSTIALKIAPTVTFTGAPGSAPNYSTFTVAGTTNSSTSAVYTASGACTNSGAVYTMASDSGTCISTATWAEDNNYNGATAAQMTAATTGTPPAREVHVGNLTKSSSSGGTFWVAGVSTLVHDANHQPVVGATLTGAWSKGYTGTGTCVTSGPIGSDPGGYCTITSGRIANTSKQVTFTVKGIILSGYTYKASANHDITGDSNGTTMVVKKP